MLKLSLKSLTVELSGLGNPEPLEFPLPPLLSLLLARLLRLVLTASDDLPPPSSSCKFCFKKKQILITVLKREPLIQRSTIQLHLEHLNQKCLSPK